MLMLLANMGNRFREHSGNYYGNYYGNYSGNYYGN